MTWFILIRMMKVELTTVTNENLREIINLKVYPSESDFVAPNVFSIAEAYVSPDLNPCGIYADEQLVGFVMFGRWVGEENFWVTRLMIDPSHRKKGIATQALKLVIAELFNKEECERIYITFVPENIQGQRVYTKLGFVDSGRTVDGELIYELKK